MIWALVVVVTLAAVWCFLRTPFRRGATDLLKAGSQAFAVMSSRRISDHWKEKVLPRYAGQMFMASGTLFLCLLALVVPVAAGELIARLWGADLIGAMSTWQGLGLSLLTASVQMRLVRPRPDREPSYGPLQKSLHYGVLATPGMGEALFDLEVRRTGGAEPQVAAGRHVFVGGLARAGTTVLMRSLHTTGQFGSLTYADMPFVLAPNLWAALKGRSRQGPLQERAHGDGVLVDYHSPEALEEVFWQTFARRDYVGERCLLPHSLDDELKSRFLDYVGAILQHCRKQRYLSKNNNNVLRLTSLGALFPNARFLVPFRQPLQQAGSLMTQHRRFSERQRTERFTRSYMGWLGHYEFGLDHRRMVFGDFAASAARYPDPARLEAWLEQWVAVHRFLLACSQDNPRQVLLVGYELLCEQTEAFWPRLCERLDLPTGDLPALRGPATQRYDCGQSILLQQAHDLYQELNRQCRLQLEMPAATGPELHHRAMSG